VYALTVVRRIHVNAVSMMLRQAAASRSSSSTTSSSSKALKEGQAKENSCWKKQLQIL
jgi:hypothetical protein